MGGPRLATELDIATWLNAEGFEFTYSHSAARALLEAQGLTRAGRSRMAADKTAAAREQIARLLVKTCDDAGCVLLASEAKPRRQQVTVPQPFCAVCEGSNAKRAVLLMVRACRIGGMRRLLIVGGTPVQHRDLQKLAGEVIEFRFVAGKEGNPNKRHALADLNWAQFMVVWASTPLPHRVSTPYTDERPTTLPMITVARRGIEALCDEVTRSLSLRR